MILFSCEFWEIYKNTFFTEHLRVPASVKIEKLNIYKDILSYV